MKKKKYITSENIFKEGLPDCTNELQHDYIERLHNFSREEIREYRKREEEYKQEEIRICLMRGCAWDDPLTLKEEKLRDKKIRP